MSCHFNQHNLMGGEIVKCKETRNYFPKNVYAAGAILSRIPPSRLNWYTALVHAWSWLTFRQMNAFEISQLVRDFHVQSFSCSITIPIKSNCKATTFADWMPNTFFNSSKSRQVQFNISFNGIDPKQIVFIYPYCSVALNVVSISFAVAMNEHKNTINSPKR